MPRGHGYLVAIMDWHSRAVLAWEVSNSMDAEFCIRALQRAFERTGRKPKVFNTDQGSQFTSPEWIQAIEGRSIKVRMDGKGRWMDNVLIERLWRSVKYEKLRLWSYQTVGEASQLVSDGVLQPSPEPHSARRLITVGGLRTRNHDCNRGIKSSPTDQLDHQ